MKGPDRDGRCSIADLVRTMMAAIDPERAAFDRVLRERTPRLVVLPLLVSINTAIYVVMLVTEARAFDSNAVLRWGASYGPLVGAGEWWRIASSAFVHTGFWHFTLNVLALVYVGVRVERLVGPAMFLVCYLTTAIVGSSVSLFLHPTRVTLGAFGAVFGIVGMLMSTIVAWRRLSARQVVAETVAAFDERIAPLSRSITTLDLSPRRAATDRAASAPSGESHPQRDRGTGSNRMLGIGKLFAVELAAST